MNPVEMTIIIPQKEIVVLRSCTVTTDLPGLVSPGFSFFVLQFNPFPNDKS